MVDEIAKPTLTENAVLLSGYLAATVCQGRYSVKEAHPENGEIVIESETGNRFSVYVRQISGQR